MRMHLADCTSSWTENGLRMEVHHRPFIPYFREPERNGPRISSAGLFPQPELWWQEFDTTEPKPSHLRSGEPNALTVPPLYRMPPATLQPYTLISPDDSRMYLTPQVQPSPTILKTHQGRTSFTQKQHKGLEALFSRTMFPDTNLRKELAVRLNLQEKTIKVWFRNRRFKLRKQQKQQEQSLQQSSQVLQAKKNVPSSLRMSTNPDFFPPVVLNFNSSLPCPPTSPSDCSDDFIFAESPEIDFHIHDPPLERLESSVPVLFPDSYDITQVIELYSFPDEWEASRCSFSCLYQYLPPARSQIEGQGISLSICDGPAVGPAPGQTCIPSMMSQGSSA